MERDSVHRNRQESEKMTFAGFFTYGSSSKFKGVILSATASGPPGNAVASTSSTTFSDTFLCCSSAKTVKFSNAPKLTKGKQYFVAVECANKPCHGGWNVANTDFAKSALDVEYIESREKYNYHYTHTMTYTYETVWHESESIPPGGAMIIK
jgi:hypothetical protein